MSGVVVFLHGMRGDEESHWKLVPDFVEAALRSFAIVKLPYSGELNSYADVGRSAEQVLTRIKSNYASNEPICLVGYSMGGIVAREICLKLLESPKPKKDEGEIDWLQKVRAVVTVGSPLCGLQPKPKLAGSAFQSFLSDKVKQVGDADFIFGRYKKAIEAASARGVKGPKQVHIEIENDGICSAHNRNAYTTDDHPGGVIRGTHREFLDNIAAEKHLAQLIVDVIRDRHASLGHKRPAEEDDRKPRATVSPKQTATPAVAPPRELPVRVLLLACSNRKETGGATTYGGPGAASWIKEAGLRDEVLSRRAKVLSLLKAGQIDNGFERAENRLHQAPNIALRRGSDFGGITEEPVQSKYLPAWQRYTGRCYAQIRKTSWEKYYAEPERQAKLSVLIMSGLYGIIDAAEWIQEYDIHLTDRVLDSGIPISAMWSDLFTQSIIEYVRSAHRGRKIEIVNCLCDEAYVDSIHWHKLPSECSVFHIASPQQSGTNLLPSAGVFADWLLNEPENLRKIQRTTRDQQRLYPLSNFGRPPEHHSSTEIAFERRLGDLRASEDEKVGA